MAYTALKDVPLKVAHCVPFQGNSIKAVLDTDGEYRIYSYSTLMTTIKGGEVTFHNKQRYSVTTSKHQGKIAHGLAVGHFLLAPDAEVWERG